MAIDALLCKDLAGQIEGWRPFLAVPPASPSQRSLHPANLALKRPSSPIDTSHRLGDVITGSCYVRTRVSRKVLFDQGSISCRGNYSVCPLRNGQDPPTNWVSRTVELLDDLQEFFFLSLSFLSLITCRKKGTMILKEGKKEKKVEKEGRNTTESVNSISRRYNTVLGQGKTDRLVINVNKEERGWQLW